MSASDLPLAGLSVVCRRLPTDRATLADATRRLVEGLPTKKARMTWLAKKMNSRAYKPATLDAAIADQLTNGIALEGENLQWHIDLNFSVRVPESDYHRRWQSVIAAPSHVPAMLTFAQEVGAQMGLISGSLAGHRDFWYAHHEDTLIATGDRVDPATDQRLGEDAMLKRRAQTRLRRLYPITIIGPELWAQLPPMPRFDPMPTIEDFDDAKLLRAWPTLCEPRDPAFLRANRELRAWLWPYTIQNPADHVDQDPR